MFWLVCCILFLQYSGISYGYTLNFNRMDERTLTACAGLNFLEATDSASSFAPYMLPSYAQYFLECTIHVSSNHTFYFASSPTTLPNNWTVLYSTSSNVNITVDGITLSACSGDNGVTRLCSHITPDSHSPKNISITVLNSKSESSIKFIIPQVYGYQPVEETRQPIATIFGTAALAFCMVCVIGLMRSL